MEFYRELNIIDYSVKFKMKLLFTFLIAIYCLVLFIRESQAQKIDLVVNYEALCPDSVRFINNQLSKAVLNFKNEINVSLIPFGIADVSKMTHCIIKLSWFIIYLFN